MSLAILVGPSKHSPSMPNSIPEQVHTYCSLAERHFFSSPT